MTRNSAERKILKSKSRLRLTALWNRILSVVIVQQPSQLCIRCLSIKLDKIAIAGPQDDRPRFDSFVMILDSIEVLSASSCPLCNLFATIGNGRFSRGDVNVYLFIQDAGEVWGGKSAGDPVTYLFQLGKSLSFEPENSICIHQPHQDNRHFGVRLVSRESFDISFVSSCLNYCQKNHGHNCESQDSRILKDLKVIHCETKKIVAAPQGCQYVALSYVWGPPPSNGYSKIVSAASKVLLDSCPKTIIDAMAVALKFNVKYLWTDRYCINQSDHLNKQSQISQMDLIYANSYFCIIAAAGEGPDYGLPGVNGTLRTQQPTLCVGKHILASTLRRPETVLDASKWATRGWTFQEGILSKRRLIFTEEQLFYECNGMHCEESWIMPLDGMHESDKSKFHFAVPRGAFSFLKNPGSNPWSIMSYINHYSKRDLTYVTDKIKAVQGIFHAFERGQNPLYHFIGVPILPPTYCDDNEIITTSRSPEECFLIGLTWHFGRISRGERVVEFPSWSWAGWGGTDYSDRFHTGKFWKNRFLESNVWIETDEKHFIRFPKTIDELPEFLSSPSLNDRHMFLQIETRTFDFEYLPITDCVKIQVGEDIWMHTTYNGGSFDERLIGKKVIALILGDGDPIFQTGIIIVEEKDGFFERVGSFGFRYPDYPKLEFVGSGKHLITKSEIDSIIRPWFKKLPKRRIRLG